MSSAVAQRQSSSSAPDQTAGTWSVLWGCRLDYTHGAEATTGVLRGKAKGSLEWISIEDWSSWAAWRRAKKIFQKILLELRAQANKDVLRRDDSGPMKVQDC